MLVHDGTKWLTSKTFVIEKEIPLVKKNILVATSLNSARKCELTVNYDQNEICWPSIKLLSNQCDLKKISFFSLVSLNPQMISFLLKFGILRMFLRDSSETQELRLYGKYVL